ncbi:MAG: M15 family metallopeptidase [Lachnospiraceae bacterium]|nr:M15 family metallopeptidase [Lachnospiraceae bacterium]
MDLKKIIKSLGMIACIIILCTVIVKLTVPNETLLDYANENPELAYPSPEETDTKNPGGNMTDVSPSENPENTTTSTPSVATVDSFYYEELTDEVKARITGISYPITEEEADSLAVPAVNLVSDPATLQISYDDLRYLKVLYYDFDGNVQEGELICNVSIAEDLKEIFYELYRNQYPIQSIRLIDDYNGDDTASMEANNTSCFNYRVVDGTTSLSKHALGCAIDINPFYNPYVVFDKTGNGQDYISPKGSEIYADRSKDFAYKIDEQDLCYRLFKEHGFTWGGNWNSCKDYQHFQKTP